jgi:hypothetical protein
MVRHKHCNKTVLLVVVYDVKAKGYTEDSGDREGIGQRYAGELKGFLRIFRGKTQVLAGLKWCGSRIKLLRLWGKFV